LDAVAILAIRVPDVFTSRPMGFQLLLIVEYFF
jgi:hypothetical protein